jgi:hypothetical protein
MLLLTMTCRINQCSIEPKIKFSIILCAENDLFILKIYLLSDLEILYAHIFIL